jgi:hypothetical protein
MALLIAALQELGVWSLMVYGQGAISIRTDSDIAFQRMVRDLRADPPRTVTPKGKGTAWLQTQVVYAGVTVELMSPAWETPEQPSAAAGEVTP